MFNSGSPSKSHLHYEVIDVEIGHADPLPFIQDYDFSLNFGEEKVDRMEISSKPINKKYKVIIDPGHGGIDNGAVSSQLLEKDIVLKIAQKLKKHLNNTDQIEIVLTRESDQLLHLNDRVALSKGADLFISLHLDKVEDENRNTIMPFYLSEGAFSEDSKRIAKIIANEFIQAKYPTEVAYSNGISTLKNAACTPLLLNLGNISNSSSDFNLNSEKRQNEIALIIANGIKKAL